jgi:glycosyltransferase involved in cell wall biosynthesis
MNGRKPSLICTSQALARQWQDNVNGDFVYLNELEGKGKFSKSIGLWKYAMSNRSSGSTLVIFTYFLTFAVPLLKPILRRKNIRVVLDNHDYLDGRISRALIFWASAKCDLVVSVSKFSQSQMHQSVRALVLVRPVEIPPLAHKTPVAKLQGNTPTFGIIGRVVQQKGIEFAARAFKDSKINGTLVIRGDLTLEPGYVSELKRISEIPGKSEIRIEAAVPQEAAYSDIDIVIISNSREALGRTVLEAQMLGVLVVAPTSGGSSELVQDGVTGFTYKADSEPDLKEILAKAIRTKGPEIVDAARASALKLTNPKKYADEYWAATAMGPDLSAT